MVRLALHARRALLSTPLDPFAQYLVDTRLPTRPGRAEIPEHLGREANMGVDLRVSLFRPAARAGEGALRRTYHFSSGRNLGTVELFFHPFRRIVGINPDAPGSALF